MAAPTVCTVSGTCRDLGGNALGGVTITARNSRPFIHPTDSSLVMPYEVSTTSSGVDGTWSLSLVETTTPAISIVITLQYPMNSTANEQTRDYTVTIPNSASATFSSLITGEV